MASGQGAQRGARIGERDKAIQEYYADLNRLAVEQRVEHEGGLRSAFENLLRHYARQLDWTLIGELTLANGERPDGALRDNSLF